MCVNMSSYFLYFFLCFLAWTNNDQTISLQDLCLSFYPKQNFKKIFWCDEEIVGAVEIIFEEEIVRAVESVVRYTLPCDIQHSSPFSLCLPKFPWPLNNKFRLKFNFSGRVCVRESINSSSSGEVCLRGYSTHKFRGSLSSGSLNQPIPGKSVWDF